MILPRRVWRWRVGIDLLIALLFALVVHFTPHAWW